MCTKRGSLQTLMSFLKEPANMDSIRIKFSDEYKQSRVRRYVKTFGVNEQIADAVVSSKPKFVTENDEIVSFDATQDTYPKEISTILKTKKICEMDVTGTIIDNKSSWSFPRKYTIETDQFDEPVQVITHRWAAVRSLVIGDKVTVHGTLRSNEKEEYQIFLETEKHYLLPYSQAFQEIGLI